LGRRIAARIGDSGPITFAEFMALALYHPELGYYSSDRPRWGAGGDYVTTPQVHPAVGRSVARLAAETDAALGAPPVYTLVECGCGDGRLLSTVLETIEHESPDLYRRLAVFAIERGAHSRAALKSTLPAAPGGLTVVADIDELPAGSAWRGTVFSNELLDAFPVERVRLVGGRLQQSQVTLDEDGGLVESYDASPHIEVAGYLRANEVELHEGQTAEICPSVAQWVAAVAARLEAGSVLTIDYGHETRTLYGPQRPHGTLVCQRGFELDDRPLAAPGYKDITAHVDFGNLRRVGREHGLADHELTSLRVFLLGMGAGSDPSGSVGERLGLRHLLVSDVGDRHRVLLQSRGLPPGKPVFGRARLEA
jgi:SAM-dependent MidA family methyltransferase